jgi:hypothetical protein
MLHKTHFEEQHIYRVEWLPDANDGYVVWYKRAPRSSHRSLAKQRRPHSTRDARYSVVRMPRRRRRVVRRRLRDYTRSFVVKTRARAPHQTTPRVASSD